MVKKFLCLLLWGVFLLLTGCGQQSIAADEGYEVTDSQGSVIKLPQKPQRIVTLSMGTDEIMLGLVEPERLAAVNELLDDPVSSNVTALAAKIPAKLGEPSAEAIAALHPDLLVIPDWGNAEQVESFRQLGIPVVVCKGGRNLQEIKETIRLLAAAAGEKERGEILISKMDNKLAEITTKTEEIPPEKRKKVVLLSLMAGYGGKGSAFDEACRLAGVINGRAEAGIEDGRVMSKEQFAAINPDIIFLPTYNNHGTVDINKIRQEYLADPALQGMKAIQNHAFAEPREAYLYNNSQDFVFAVQEIAYVVYGEEFYLPSGCHLSAY